MLKVYSRRFIRVLTRSAVILVVFLLGRPLLSSSKTIVIAKSSFDWSAYAYHHPLQSITPLPSGKPRPWPPIQYNFRPETRPAGTQRRLRQQAVLKTFKKCWKSYKTHAWMKDELRPISAKGKTTFGGWAATLVDALDTLWIMGLQEDFYEVREAAATIDWAITPDTSCNMYETNIRYLGGLLAAYDLSQEPVLLAKAVELGDMLYAGFDTPNHMPPFWLDFEKAKTGQLVAEEHQISAAVGSFTLEFTRLLRLLEILNTMMRSLVTSVLIEHQMSTQLPGMWPTFINAREQTFLEDSFTFGALADSLYESLPKMYILLGGLEPAYEKAYKNAIAAAIEYLLFRSMLPNNTNA
jgi:mannosyl-oligosaccharide alpha-1,2-mannosidase